MCVRPADWLQVIPCNKAMLGGTLLQALETEFPQYEQVCACERVSRIAVLLLRAVSWRLPNGPSA
jgi:hypothetical protein